MVSIFENLAWVTLSQLPCTRDLNLDGFCGVRRGRGLFGSSEPGNVQCGQKDQRQNSRDQQASHDCEGHWPPEHRRSDRYHAEHR